MSKQASEHHNRAAEHHEHAGRHHKEMRKPRSIRSQDDTKQRDTTHTWHMGTSTVPAIMRGSGQIAHRGSREGFNREGVV
jgi:hypothetical protein